MPAFHRLRAVFIVILSFLIVGCEISTPIQPTPTPENVTAYLGQVPPDLTPQVFAPGLVSISSAFDYAITFSPDGTDLYFTRRLDDSENQNIYEMHLVNGNWTDPTPVPFSAEHNAHEPHLTADNQTLYFGWFRPPPPGQTSTLNAGIWATDRTANSWSEPRYVGEGMFVSSDQSGQVYVTNFASGAPSLSKVTLTDGRFTDWEIITVGAHPAIAPDGSYLVYDDGNGYLRVKFHSEDGKWSASRDLTKHGIPTSASIASISPDGMYLFYVYDGDLYWVSTDLIKNLLNK
ncbi:MAG: hypothetical protein C4583_06945 [Anaerolineaceae bacterium]|nr:MAG: hypothetical protein C4583_06945 [Anaerolineaceae bacterium]